MLTAIYDGRCVICNTTRRVVTVLDWFGQIEFLDLHRQETVAERYPFIDHEQAMGEIHVVDARARVFAGFAGTRRMLRSLPLGWPLYVLLRLPIIGGWLGPRVYRFIAHNRYRINRLLGVDLAAEEAAPGDCDEGVCKVP